MGRAPEPSHQAELDAGPPPPSYELSTVAGSSSMAGSSSQAPMSPPPAHTSSNTPLTFDPAAAPDFSKPDPIPNMASSSTLNNSSYNNGGGSSYNNGNGPGNYSNDYSNDHGNGPHNDAPLTFNPNAAPDFSKPVLNHTSTGYHQTETMSPFPPPTSAPPPNLAVVPLNMLQRQPAPILCPSCNVRGMSYAENKNGKYMHTVACLCCTFTLMGCFAYCFGSLKDTHHKCGNCGVALATYHRSGHTDVHRYSK